MSDTTIKTDVRTSVPPPSVERTPRAGRQFRLIAVRCLGLQAAVFAVAMVWFALMIYFRMRANQLQPYGLPGAVDVERFMLPAMVVAAGVIWQCCFFTAAMCHGVSRRSFVKASAIGAAALSLALAVVMVGARLAVLVSQGCLASAGGTYRYQCGDGEPFVLRSSERFLYAWMQTGSACDGAACSTSNDMTTTYAMLPAGPLFMFLKFLSLMLAWAALGMLIGAVLSWAAGKGYVVLGLLAVLCGAAYGLMGPGSPVYLWLAGTDAGNLLASVVSGGIVSIGVDAAGSVTNGVTRTTYAVWIPVVCSLVLFALCLLVTDRLTMRREIRPGRGRLG